MKHVLNKINRLDVCNAVKDAMVIKFLLFIVLS